MALRSMTGFGRGEASGRLWRVEAEASAVNRKQFDVQVGLPRTLTAMEPLVYDAVRRRLARGSVTVSVRVSAAEGGVTAGAGVDLALAATYLRALRRAAARLGLADDVTARTLATLPDVVRRQGPPEGVPALWPLARRALAQALDGLIAMRAAEGGALQRDLTRRLARLTALQRAIRRAAPRVLARYRRLIEARLLAAGVETVRGDTAFHRDLVMFADRSNITEELVRLESHFRQAADLLRAREPVGRTLDFLCQEMFREINTVGSKANDAGISARVVAFKTELECVREQVQNVE